MNSLAALKISYLAGTLGAGGAERQLFYILKTLREAGARVRLFSFSAGEFWEKSLRDLGVPVVALARTPSKLGRLLALWKELRREPGDILQSQHFYTNAYAALIARLAGPREIGAMRNNGASEVLDCGRWGGNCNLRAPRLLAANSQAAIRFALRSGLSMDRLHFLPNVVDTVHLQPARAAGAAAPKLLFVGRLEAQKRPERFLSILAKVRAQRSEVQGVIVGTGRLKDKLEKQAHQLSLGPDALAFRGALADMRPAYHEAAVCVLTSDHEGTPNVLLEAMATGVPVVATRVGGVPDIVQHGESGFLFAPEDVEGMTQALLRLLDDHELRFSTGRRARAFVEAAHSLTRLPQFLGSLYDRALSAAPEVRGLAQGEASRA